MMIRLTDKQGKPVAVNTDHIVSIYIDYAGDTCVSMGNDDDFYAVSQTFDEVMNLIHSKIQSKT